MCVCLLSCVWMDSCMGVVYLREATDHAQLRLDGVVSCVRVYVLYMP